jgi:hypothetical protein
MPTLRKVASGVRGIATVLTMKVYGATALGAKPSFTTSWISWAVSIRLAFVSIIPRSGQPTSKQDALEGIKNSEIQEIHQIQGALKRIAGRYLWFLCPVRRRY